MNERMGITISSVFFYGCSVLEHNHNNNANMDASGTLERAAIRFKLRNSEASMRKIFLEDTTLDSLVNETWEMLLVQI